MEQGIIKLCDCRQIKDELNASKSQPSTDVEQQAL
jgi:hypothetical protein